MPKKEEYAINQCPIDGTVIRNERGRTPDYTEYWLLLSNGTKMRVALCVSCAGNMDDTKAKKALDHVKRLWSREAESAGGRVPKEYSGLRSTGHAKIERDIPGTKKRKGRKDLPSVSPYGN